MFFIVLCCIGCYLICYSILLYYSVALYFILPSCIINKILLFALYYTLYITCKMLYNTSCKAELMASWRAGCQACAHGSAHHQRPEPPDGRQGVAVVDQVQGFLADSAFIYIKTHGYTYMCICTYICVYGPKKACKILVWALWSPRFGLEGALLGWCFGFLSWVLVVWGLLQGSWIAASMAL